ncbi:MAG: hypothetical protein, partial [Olavius algarvensis Delta 4 endosymbiont]
VAPDSRRGYQYRNRGHTLHQPPYRQKPRHQYLQQAGGQRPHPGRCLGRPQRYRSPL